MASLRQWLKNARSVSLMQSLMPALLAVILAFGEDGFNIILAVLAVIGVEAAHLCLNLSDDYFDYRSDMLSDREKIVRKGFRAMMVKYPYLTDGSETPASLKKAIASFGAAALLCGAVIFASRTSQFGLFGERGSIVIVIIALVTAFLGVFYTAPPLRLAFYGLGEPVIGLIFGPLLMCGVYYACTGSLNWGIVGISIPVGLLVLNILYTHSFIEKAGDAESGKMTLARLAGSDKTGLALAYAINLLPFVIVGVSVACGSLHPMYLLCLAVLPRSLWLCRSLTKFSMGETGVPDKPSRLLGPMGDWAGIRKAGIDWFMMRWLTARNTLSGFCALIIIARIIVLTAF